MKVIISYSYRRDMSSEWFSETIIIDTKEEAVSERVEKLIYRYYPNLKINIIYEDKGNERVSED